MRIQNNIMAMNTHRFYTANNNAVSKSAEKLSSGYRVNRAGDDAAGLAISEKMRAEIRGLSMASKNAQDGVSMVQTAEGALTEVQAMLQRMKEIAVQAASDSNEDEIDRPALNQEFQALIKEIDDVAKTTTFNDMKLLDGSFQDKVIQIGSRTGNEMEISIGNMSAAALGLAEAAAADVPTMTGLTVGTVNAGSDVVPATYSYNGTLGGTPALATGVSGTIAESVTTALDEAKISEAYFAAGGTATTAQNITFEADAGDTTKINMLVGGIKVGSATVAANATVAENNGTYELSFGDLGSFTITNTAAANSNANDMDAAAIKAALTGTNATGGTFTASKTETAAEQPATKASFTVTAANFTLTKTNEDGATQALTSGKVTLSHGTDELTVDVKDTDGDGTLTDTEVASAFNGKTFKIGDAEFVGAAADGVVTFTAKTEGKVAAIDTAAAGTAPAVAVDAGAKVDLLNQDNASEAIDLCRDALNQVSTQRAELGAIQNRLEHKISNLDNTVENVSAAESRIRDVDIAKEMTNFTKNNILSQAATAMLAQANSLPQGVLSLLQ